MYSLHSGLFMQLSEETSSPVRWFSKGGSLARALQTFLVEKQVTTSSSTFQWHRMGHETAFLCDIFNLLNEHNLSLKGKMTTVFELA